MKNLPFSLYLLKSTLPLGACFFALFQNTASSQELTPARQLGQASATNPYEITADGSTRLRPREIPANSMAAATGEGSDTDAWWEGMDQVAKETVRSEDWALHYGVTTAFEYDDNFNLGRATPGGPILDSPSGEAQIISVSPYGVLTYGQPGHGVDFQLRYSPEFRWFSEDSLDEVFNHGLGMQLGINGSRSRLDIGATYSRNQGGNIEVGSLVESDIVGVNIGGSYDVSPKTTIGANIGSSINIYDVFNNFSTYSTAFFVDYSIAPKTRIGLGVGYSNTQQENNLTANAYTMNLRIGWAATEKLGLSGAIGLEQRDYDGGNSITSTVGNFGIYYNLTAKTSFQISAYRNASPSIGVANGMFYSTGVALTGAFQISQRLSTNVGVGYENAQYESTGGGIMNREDNYYFVRPAISYFMSSHLSLSLFYQYSSNESSGRLVNSFERNQIGIFITLAY